MNYLSVDTVSKSFGERQLFEDISFGLSRGQKMALVGANGTGKSTLLKVITGEHLPDKGEVSFRKDIRIAHLLQTPEFPVGATAKECIFQGGNPIADLIERYNHLINSGDASADAMQEVLDEMEAKDAWNYEAKVDQVTGKLGLKDLSQKVDSMSGGQRKRVALAQLILSEPDLFILDEPTNHLDLEAIEWLENYLSDENVTLLMVTHDRYFMDKVADQIIELDRSKLYHHQGKYAYYLQKKAEREEVLSVEVEKARNLYKKELDWIRRQPKARGTKAKYRIDAFQDTKAKAKTDLKKDQLDINVKAARQGRKIIELDNIQKSFGNLTISNGFSYTFKKQERVGIVGKNGVGKSTFLDMLTGKLAPDEGTVTAGETTQIGYFTQESIGLNPENRVIEEVKEIAEFITLGDGTQVSASKFLDLFLFSPEKQYTYIDKLSGGEKKRLQLLKVLVKSPNFLILDEPTNDLDIDTMNVLEDFLLKFPGCLMMVSHDRYFMDRLVDHLFIFEGDGEIKDFNGNYSDYREYLKEKQKQEAQALLAPKKKEVEKAPEKTSTQKKLSYKEKLEYETLEKEIEKLEEQKALVTKQLNSGETDHQKLTDWSQEIENLDGLIDEKSMRWLELGEMGALD